MGTETQIPVGQSNHNKYGKKENSRIRKLKESAFNHCTDHVISQPTIDINLIWLPVITSEIKKNVTGNISRVKIDSNPRAVRGVVISVLD